MASTETDEKIRNRDIASGFFALLAMFFFFLWLLKKCNCPTIPGATIKAPNGTVIGTVNGGAAGPAPSGDSASVDQAWYALVGSTIVNGANQVLGFVGT